MSAKEELAKLRLQQTGRECDGCGGKIGRWTARCFYDARRDHAYCSTGGCAERARSAPSCVCGLRQNPFAEGPVPGEWYRCPACREQGPSEGIPCVDLSQEELDLPAEVVEDALNGPYLVIEKRVGWYQVVLPVGEGRVKVRSASDDLTLLVRLCARFNAA